MACSSGYQLPSLKLLQPHQHYFLQPSPLCSLRPPSPHPLTPVRPPRPLRLPRCAAKVARPARRCPLTRSRCAISHPRQAPKRSLQDGMCDLAVIFNKTVDRHGTMDENDVPPCMNTNSGGPSSASSGVCSRPIFARSQILMRRSELADANTVLT